MCMFDRKFTWIGFACTNLYEAQDTPQRCWLLSSFINRTYVSGSCLLRSADGGDVEQPLVHIIIIINPCKPYLSASATAPHPLGRRKAD
jgi:hypothetical protein